MHEVVLFCHTSDFDEARMGEIDPGNFADYKADPDDIIILCKTWMFHAHLAQKPFVICPAAFKTKLDSTGPRGGA